MRIIKGLVFAVILLILIAGCSSSVKEEEQSKLSKLENENSMLTEQIANLIEDRNESQGVTLNEPLSMAYVTYDAKKRLVLNPSQILALPIKGAYIFRPIQPNTVVTIFDAVTTPAQNGLWLYVEVPVYDTPSDMKGWIPEAETVALTKDNVQLVQSDLTVGIGTPVCEVYEFEKIYTTKPNYLTYEMRGRLEEKRNGWARLTCPGGLDIWVLEKDLKYPVVE
jgi:outer membrane murein-binding lipoprotein Lpp